MSPKQLADALGTSESSVRRWCDSGKLAIAKTAGGHRRISRAEALRFVRISKLKVVRPELLAIGTERYDVQSAQDLLRDSLKTGNEQVLTSALTNLFTEGVSIAAICDGPLRDAMSDLGRMWAEGDKEHAILKEHRATTLCVRALAHLRQHIDAPSTNAPVAIGGSPSEDPYLLPSWMVATVLADLGFRDVNLGASMPVELLATAAEETNAELLWLSVSVSNLSNKFLKEIKGLILDVNAQGRHLMIGGRATDDYPWPDSPYLHVFTNLREMSVFAKGYLASRVSRHPMGNGHPITTN
ncbi:MAG: helix-turn-helix domain-containing protein [Phycisphaerae bacterium]